MNVSPLSQIGQLAIGFSRTSVRWGSTRKRYKPPNPNAYPRPAGHGEKVWIWNHLSTGQIIHSLRPVLKTNKALAQLPFNGKKTKPAKLRKDLWRPMAIIQFPEGLGAVGESVYQRLREFKRLHELSWGDELLFKEDGTPTTKVERGKLLNNQKANAIADLAAVLAGRGRGNRILREGPGRGTAADGSSSETPALLSVEVYWDNALLSDFAEEWSPNVTHKLLSERPVEEKAEVEEDTATMETPPAVA